MTPTLDQRAAHAARTTYHRAAERHAEHALSELDRGNRNTARYLARLPLLVQRASAAEYEAARR